jgi:outer membrane protein OmpA-like peptidoglycan-associated protein
MRSAEAAAYLLEQPIKSSAPQGKTQRPSLWAGAGLAIGACALTGCAHTQPLAPSPVSIAAPIARPFVQARQQSSGFWELVPCVEGACPRPTPKTLAGVTAPPEVVPVALRTEAGSAPVTSGTKREAPGGEARPVASLPVQSVFFRTGSAVPDPSQTAAIQSLAPLLAGAKKIVVRGCTDRTGTPAANRRLAEQRAAALRDQLVRLGARKDRIEFQIDLSGDGNLPGPGVAGTVPGDINARARRGDIAIAIA